MGWLSSPAHHRWLESETDRLLTFGRGARAAVGFGRQDDVGHVDPTAPAELWVTCRSTHVQALGVLLGRPGCAALVDHGVAALTGPLRDGEHGGWFAAAGPAGPEGPADGAKEAYGHAFVVLAAASATVAGRPGARRLLDEALAVQLDRFWDEREGMVVESWDRAFTATEEYRGVNATMHTVEAYLAAADVTGDRAWLDRALRMTERVVHGFARANGWRLPEHFDPAWRPLLDHHRETPAHPFRPYGGTVGHWFEWSRLALHARAALLRTGAAAPTWLLDDAVALFDQGVRDGWAADGAAGFVYTVDWDGTPVVRERMHWVVCEALAAAAVLWRVTGDERVEDRYREWWEFAADHHLDHDGGSWWHELGPDNRVSRTVWAGKPDLYHAVQATLLPRLPLTPALAPALAAGLLG